MSPRPAAVARYVELIHAARECEALYAFDKAELLYRKASSVQPRYSTAYAALGRLFQAKADWKNALESFTKVTLLRAGPAGICGPEGKRTIVGRSLTASKLRHDIDQVEYLLREGFMRKDARRLRRMLDTYSSILKVLGEGNDADIAFEVGERIGNELKPFYGRILHLKPPKLNARHALNPRLNFKKLEDAYLRSKPRVLVIDDILTSEAWTALRRHCLESTIWANALKDRALSSTVFDGVACEPVYRIAEDLADRMPRVFEERGLTGVWGYKYDSTSPGLGVHADQGGVNANFWLTPDSAVLDSSSGGMCVYDVLAPKDWSYSNFGSPANRRMLAFLRSGKPRKLRIPYRANRAIIFESQLFHSSEPIRFREGYENRRVNMTYQFGDPRGFPGISRGSSWKDESEFLVQAMAGSGGR
jgi:tetratricopeptide (TPR) repeat protein